MTATETNWVGSARAFVALDTPAIAGEIAGSPRVAKLRILLPLRASDGRWRKASLLAFFDEDRTRLVRQTIFSFFREEFSLSVFSFFRALGEAAPPLRALSVESSVKKWHDSSCRECINPGLQRVLFALSRQAVESKRRRHQFFFHDDDDDDDNHRSCELFFFRTPKRCPASTCGTSPRRVRRLR